MNEFLTQFHFLRPAWLLLIIPTITLGIYLLRRHNSALQWEHIIAPHLLPHLVDGNAGPVKRAPILIVIVLWLIASLALAGPTWKKLPQPLHRETSALVVAWDLSPSMLAKDIKPSRLVRSRLKLIDLLRQRKEGLTALIAYSGEAHVVTPLTDDTETIISLLHGLDPQIMPAKGSNAEMALTLANKLLKDSSITRGDILFLTDGIDQAAHEEMAAIHAGTGHKVSVWGIGTAEGAPIPLANGGFAYGRNGDMVIAKLNDNELSDIASDLGGIYFPFTQSEFDLESIHNFVFNPTKEDSKTTSREFDQWYEYGPYLLLMLLPFAAFSFRRGWLVSIAICTFLIPVAPPADALEWQDLWKTKDRQALELLNKDPKQAAQLFENKNWKAIANYKAKEFEKALEGFDGDSARDHFNRGTTLTRLGQYDEAIDQFKEALKKKPDYAAAEKNLEVTQKLKELAQQQEQEQQQNQDGQSDNQNPSDNQQQSEQNSDQQQNDQAESQQQTQENSSKEQQQQNANSEESDSQQSEQQQALNEEQQKALEEKYGKEEQGKQQENEDEPSDEQQQATQQMTAKKEDADKQDSAEEEQKEAAKMAQQYAATPKQEAMSEEQREKQQSLQQWLRKVPDDPSGLLRNKFRYEYQQRKQQFLQQPRRQGPGYIEDEERW